MSLWMLSVVFFVGAIVVVGIIVTLRGENAIWNSPPIEMIKTDRPYKCQVCGSVIMPKAERGKNG